MTTEHIAQRLWRGWHQIAFNSTNRRIFGAAITIGVLTFGVKLASMVKDIIVAASFGTGDALDAFLIAYLLPMYIMNVVGGSFNTALIPVYIQIQEQEGREAVQRLFSSVVVLSTGLLGIVSLLLALAGPYILRLLSSGFSPEKLALTEGLFYALLPTIVISGLATIWDAALTAAERFALTSFVSITIPVTSVACLLLLGHAWGSYALALGIVIGLLLEVCLLGAGLKRQGLSLRLRWYGLVPGVRQVFGQYLPAMAGAALMSSTVLVDQAMAAILEPGSVAVLNYSNKTIALVLSIGTMALGTAVLPYFSKMVATADWIGVRHTLRTYVILTLATTIPLTVFLYLFSELIVRVLFQRGAFTEDDVHLVAQVQAMYLLQIPFHTVVILFVRLISSLQANYILMWGTVISFLINIFFDYILMQNMGVAGIALSTSIVYMINLCFLSIMSYRLLSKA
jgi:putative peptidoglycan lipid II flippase